MKSSYIELELLSKNRILFHQSSWDKIYNLIEKTHTSIVFSSKFPFVSFKKSPYVTFKLRTHYTYLDSIADPRYNVNCTLCEFARLFGHEVAQFEETIVKCNLCQ